MVAQSRVEGLPPAGFDEVADVDADERVDGLDIDNQVHRFRSREPILQVVYTDRDRNVVRAVELFLRRRRRVHAFELNQTRLAIGRQYARASPLGVLFVSCANR